MKSFGQVNVNKEFIASSDLNKKIISQGNGLFPSASSNIFTIISNQPKEKEENITPNTNEVIEDLNMTITEEDDEYTVPIKKKKEDFPQICNKEEQLLYSKHQDNCDYDGLDGKFLHGRWSTDEHKAFIEALLIYGNHWNKVQRHIKTRSSAQARSHAQKFYIRIRKSIFEKEKNMAKPSKEKIQALFRDKFQREIQPKQIEKFIDTLINSVNNKTSCLKLKTKNIEMTTVSNCAENNRIKMNLSNFTICDLEDKFESLKSSRPCTETDWANMLFPESDDEEIILNKVEKRKAYFKRKAMKKKDLHRAHEKKLDQKNRIKIKNATKRSDNIFLIEKVRRVSTFTNDNPGLKSPSRNNVHIPTVAQQTSITNQSKSPPRIINSPKVKANNTACNSNNTVETLKKEVIPNFLLYTNHPSSSIGNNDKDKVNNWSVTNNNIININLNNKDFLPSKILGNVPGPEPGATPNDSSHYFNQKTNSFINILTINLLNEANKEQSLNNNSPKMTGEKVINSNTNLRNNDSQSEKPSNSERYVEKTNENLANMQQNMSTEEQENLKMLLHYQQLLKQSQRPSSSNGNNISTSVNSTKINVKPPDVSIINPSLPLCFQPANNTPGNPKTKLPQMTAQSELEINTITNPFNIDFNQSLFPSNFDKETEDLNPSHVRNSYMPSNTANAFQNKAGVFSINNSSNENNPSIDFDHESSFDIEKIFN